MSWQPSGQIIPADAITIDIYVELYIHGHGHGRFVDPIPLVDGEFRQALG